MPTLRQLEYLVAVADARHFGRAAAAVHVSKPTVSQQLRVLEARPGVTLVERGDSPVQLTPIGSEIAERRDALRSASRICAARHAAASRAWPERSADNTLGPYLMPGVVARLYQEHPDLRLYMREGIPDDQIAESRRGALDMVLTPLPLAGTAFTIEPLFREPLHILAAPDHPLFRSLAEQGRSVRYGPPQPRSAPSLSSPDGRHL